MSTTSTVAANKSTLVKGYFLSLWERIASMPTTMPVPIATPTQNPSATLPPARGMLKLLCLTAAAASAGMCAAVHLGKTLLGEVVKSRDVGLSCGSSVCMILLRIAVSIHPAQGAIQSLPPPMHLKYIYTQ